MSDPNDHELVLLFEYPSFIDAFDAQRQSRLVGFHYRTDHTQFATLCARLAQRWPADVAQRALAKPLDAVPDNTALYMLRIRPEGREALLPALIDEAVAMGFTVHDDSRGHCYCPQGLWTVDGLQPLPGGLYRPGAAVPK